MTQLSFPSPSLTLRTYLNVLHRRRRFIVLVAVVVAFLAVLPGILADPVYASTAKIQIGSLKDETAFVNQDAVSPTAQVIDIVNEIQILQSPTTEAEVRNQLPGREFDGPIVIPVIASEMIEVTVRADDPTVAADVVNTFATVFVEDRQSRSVATLTTQEHELRTQSAAATAEIELINAQLDNPDLAPSQVTGLQLQQSQLADKILDFDRRADQFAVDAALRGEATQIVTRGVVDADPLASNTMQSAVIGAVLGLLLGLGLAVVIDLAQDKVASADDLESIDPDVPVLTTVPHAELHPGRSVQDHSVLEAFRYLKTGIRLYGLSADAHSVIVTSAIGNEGKSTTAALLAREMSDATDRVVLIDCDLRRPTVHEHFDISNDVGLTSLILGDAEIGDAICFVEDNLAVVTAGPPVHNPTEMMGSKPFAEVLQAIVNQADFTILDSPPVLPVADSLIAGQLVDASIVVTRVGEVRRRSLRQLLRRLDEADIPVVGFVANDLPRSAYYGDYQGYDYFEPRRTPPAGVGAEGENGSRPVE